MIIISLALAGILALLVSQINRLRPPSSIRLAAGPRDEHEYQIASLYADFLEREGLAVEVIPTEGSLANMALLQSGAADAGFILNMATLTIDDDVVTRAGVSVDLMALAGIGYVPIWGFYRSELETDGPLDELADLRGRRVAFGAPDSGTRALGRLLLSASDLTERDFAVVDAEPDVSAEMLLNGEIDAMFLVSGITSPTILQLAMAPDVQILNMRLAPTYARMIARLRNVEILEGSFSISKPTPPETKQMVADTSVLVARNDLHPDIQLLLLRAAIAAQGKLLDPFPSAMTFPAVTGLTLPVSETTVQYLERGQTFLEKYLPFWVASPLERFYWLVLPAMFLIYPIVRSTPSAYGALMRRRVNGWYRRLRDLELGLERFDIAELDARIAELERAEQQLLSGTVRMPDGYLQMFYCLRSDILLVVERFRQRKADLEAQDVAHAETNVHDAYGEVKR